MELYPITPVFGLLVALCFLGGARGLMLLVAAMMPFGMLAVVSLPSMGGLSLLAVNLAAAALVAWGCLVLVSRLVTGQPVRIEPATIALLVFALYAVFSATVLVRLFAGETMVFPLSRGTTGVRVSTQFAWGKVWLGPSSANISQTFYVLLACSFFVAASHALRRLGPGFGVRCMVLAASVNLALGLMDLAALDPVLDLVRTANYSLMNSATVHGVPRVIGGYSEAASFGAASAMFFGFFAMLYLQSGRLRDGVLALGSAGAAVLALSSTGIIALAVTCAALLPRLFAPRRLRIGRGQIVALTLGLMVLALAVAAVLLFTPAPEMIAKIIDDLILSKSQSSSGIERTAWAMGGLEALRDTWGMGVGTGSLRANGLLFVLLGSVGLIGTAAFMAFLWLAFGGRASAGHGAILSAARLGALSVLVTMLLAATVPDPGIPLVFLAAIAVSARARPARSARPCVAGWRRRVSARGPELSRD